MNKLIIPIIAIAILVLGIGSYLVLKPETSPSDECGDGICGPVEKADPNLCPQDCKPTPVKKTCSQQGGAICSSSETCSGSWLDASDTSKCCSIECAKTSKGKCGDGICGPVEKADPRLCPQDCEGVTCTEDWQCTSWSDCIDELQTRTCTDLNNCGTTMNKPTETKSCGEVVLDYEDSPFGAHPHTAEVNTNGFDERYLDIGVKWIRYAPMAWDIVERTKGSFDWDYTDRIIGDTVSNNIHIFYTIRSYNRWDQEELEFGKISEPMAPNDLNAFLNFLKKAVERYDGDGIDDAPNSPIVNYWQVENEVDGKFWADTPEAFANLLRESYKTIKAANPNAKVLIGGASIPRGFYDFYVDVFNALGGKYFDIMDVHWYEDAGDYKEHPIGNYELKDFIQDLRNKFNSHGYGNVPIWFTETGTYGGENVLDQSGNQLPEQGESVQAAELVKRYVYFVGNGISKVFWYQMIEVHHTGIGISNDYFENVGLVNNPQNLGGESNKKLAYYSYKKMVEILEGSDWSNIDIIQESGGIYVYKFTKQGNPIWVAWNDNSAKKDITISGITSTQVKITEAVPKYESGNDVTDYNIAFNTEIKTVQNGKMSITVWDVPVFIEE